MRITITAVSQTGNRRGEELAPEAEIDTDESGVGPGALHKEERDPFGNIDTDVKEEGATPEIEAQEWLPGGPVAGVEAVENLLARTDEGGEGEDGVTHILRTERTRDRMPKSYQTHS